MEDDHDWEDTKNLEGGETKYRLKFYRSGKEDWAVVQDLRLLPKPHFNGKYVEAI